MYTQLMERGYSCLERQAKARRRRRGVNPPSLVTANIPCSHQLTYICCSALQFHHKTNLFSIYIWWCKQAQDTYTSRSSWIKMREMVFFDVETTAPSSEGRWCLLEFGAILVCPKKLVEVDSYETLIRPGDLSAVSRRFITDENNDIASAPPFEDVAGKIFDILDGRVWAGHNIQRFDCPRIREAFAEIGRPAPEPAGVIDSLNVLASEFGRRAGDLKMATLASYFGIGKQKHRSLDDARMNLEVLKHCATVLLLESSLPHVLRPHQPDSAVTRRTASRMLQTKLPFVSSSPPTGEAPAHQKINGKRDSLGKVVARANKEALSARRPTTPFHMILRHSRTILR